MYDLNATTGTQEPVKSLSKKANFRFQVAQTDYGTNDENRI
jgi:hypothetical protein